MDDEFILECTKCSKLSLHSLTTVRSMREQNFRYGGERTTGNVDCPHCNSVVTLQLDKCNKCESAWVNFHEKPNKIQRGSFGETMMMWLATTCPSCYPEAKEDVIKYGQIQPRK